MDDTVRRLIRRFGPVTLRLVAVLLSFVLSSYGVLFGYGGIALVIAQINGTSDLGAGMAVVGLIMGYAWIAWLVLGFAWAFQRRLGAWWPISGLVSGVASVLFTFGFAVVFTFPAIIMAIVFVTFHLSEEARKIEAARRAVRSSASRDERQ